MKKLQDKFTEEEIQDYIDRPDSIWINLVNNFVPVKDTKVVDWNDITNINGDFGSIGSIVVTGVPLYPVDSLEKAHQYIINQIEIHNLKKANKKLLLQIGCCNKKYIISFGSGQLTNVDVRPLDVMLIIEAESENQAREIIGNSFIGNDFCTSYDYDEFATRFKVEHGMREYTLDELEELRND